MLGMRAKGRREHPDKASPRARTFAHFITNDTFLLILQGRASFVTEPGSSRSSSKDGPDGGPRGDRRSRWRPLPPRAVMGKAAIHGAHKYL
jgi:hypothetical protein